MQASRHSIDLFVARSVFVQVKALIYPGVKQRADQACRAIMLGLTLIRDVAGPVRHRLNAPLIGPPRFGTAREYRRWKAHRSARPQTWNALQWPLGVWFLIGVALIFWVKSVLS